MNRRRMLAVVTNVGQYEKVGYRTGLWLGELTHYMDTVERAGYECDIVSPGGGFVPIDPESLMAQELAHSVGLSGGVHERYADRAFMDRLDDTRAIGDVDVDAYDAIYMTGGHGVMFDFPDHAELAEVTGQFAAAGKVVSAVCHGPAGLLEAKVPDGRHLVDGRKVTGFSWREEILAKRDDAVPFSLEDQLRLRGGQYVKARLPFVPHVVTDGLLVTGQNPISAAPVANAVLAALGDG